MGANAGEVGEPESQAREVEEPLAAGEVFFHEVRLVEEQWPALQARTVVLHHKHLVEEVLTCLPIDLLLLGCSKLRSRRGVEPVDGVDGVDGVHIVVMFEARLLLVLLWQSWALWPSVLDEAKGFALIQVRSVLSRCPPLALAIEPIRGSVVWKVEEVDAEAAVPMHDRRSKVVVRRGLAGKYVDDLFLFLGNCGVQRRIV